jgi:hypothetical protein
MKLLWNLVEIKIFKFLSFIIEKIKKAWDKDCQPGVRLPNDRKVSTY